MGRTNDKTEARREQGQHTASAAISWTAPKPPKAGAAPRKAPLIGPVHPMQLPGDPSALSLEFRCEDVGVIKGNGDGTHWWRVLVLHQTGFEEPSTTIGQLHLATVPWSWEPEHLGFPGYEDYDIRGLAWSAFTEHTELGREINRLGLKQRGDLMVLLNVQLDEQWRGFGIGAALTAKALDFLSSGCRLAIVDIAGRGATAERLVDGVGFRRIGDCYAVRDCADDEENREHSQRLNRRLMLIDMWRTDPRPSDCPF